MESKFVWIAPADLLTQAYIYASLDFTSAVLHEFYPMNPSSINQQFITFFIFPSKYESELIRIQIQKKLWFSANRKI